MDINDTLRKLGMKPGTNAGGPRNIQGMGINQSGMIDAQFLENNGFKVKGQFFKSVIGTTEIQIKLSGTAKILIGFKFVDNYSFGGSPCNPAAIFTLKVNNSIIIETAPANAFTAANAAVNNISSPYFEFIRMLNGSDNISILLTDTAAHDYNIYFYYI